MQFFFVRIRVISSLLNLSIDMMFVKPTPLKRLTSRVVVDDNGALVDLDNMDTSGIPIVPELDVRFMSPERNPIYSCLYYCHAAWLPPGAPVALLRMRLVC
jgi:hypothetical protein